MQHFSNGRTNRLRVASDQECRTKLRMRWRSTCFGWPFRPPIVVTIMWPVSVPLPSTTVASISYGMRKEKKEKTKNKKKVLVLRSRDKKCTKKKQSFEEHFILHTFSSLIFMSFISSGKLSTPTAWLPDSLESEVGAIVAICQNN